MYKRLHLIRITLLVQLQNLCTMMVCMKNKSDDIELTLENREYQLINLKRLDNFRGKKNIMLEKLEKNKQIKNLGYKFH